jgi:hypothetical protein
MSLPGEIDRVAKPRSCEVRKCRAEAFNRICIESDSFGSEYEYMCDKHIDGYRANLAKAEPEEGECRWCKKMAILKPTRDWEEGSHGPVYYVCQPCIDRNNQVDDSEEEEEEDDDWESQEDEPDLMDDDDDEPTLEEELEHSLKTTLLNSGMSHHSAMELISRIWTFVEVVDAHITRHEVLQSIIGNIEKRIIDEQAERKAAALIRAIQAP